VDSNFEELEFLTFGGLNRRTVRVGAQNASPAARISRVICDNPWYYLSKKANNEAVRH
jgi:hypothetical protein